MHNESNRSVQGEEYTLNNRSTILQPVIIIWTKLYYMQFNGNKGSVTRRSDTHQSGVRCLSHVTEIDQLEAMILDLKFFAVNRVKTKSSQVLAEK